MKKEVFYLEITFQWDKKKKRWNDSVDREEDFGVWLHYWKKNTEEKKEKLIEKCGIENLMSLKKQLNSQSPKILQFISFRF